MIVDWLFGKKKEEEATRIPNVGEIWVFKDDKSPWKNEKTLGVKILDVQKNWVRYDMSRGTGVGFCDERMPLGSFIYCYSYKEGEQ